jgi:hypothetical protein
MLVRPALATGRSALKMGNKLGVIELPKWLVEPEKVR